MTIVYASLVFLYFFLSHRSIALDTIIPTEPVKDSSTVVSSNGAYELGFFSPVNSTDRYAGIWYSKVPHPEMGVVWVANRNNPVTDSSGGLIRISDGNLQVLNGENKTLWSSNVSTSGRAQNFPVAQLRESGNLVLLGDDGKILWQSFDHPTDTALPNMKLTVTNDSGIRKMLQSWNNLSDPSSGRFSIGIDSFAFPQLVIWDGDRPSWRSGPWNGNTFTGIQNNNSGSNIIGAGFILENDRQGTVSLTYYSANQSFSSIYALSYQGALTQKWWDESRKKWEVVWRAPETECDFYGKCGPFGSCNSKNSPICRCMKGFEPKNKSEWTRGNTTGGCMRRTQLQCERGSGKPDGFFRVKAVKVPDKADWSTGLDQDECRSNCQNNCSCLAYAYITSAGCMSWGRELVDTEELSSGGVDLYLRLAHTELGNNSNSKLAIIIIIGGCLGAASVLILVFILGRRKTEKQGKGFQRNKTVSDMFGIDEKEVNLEEVPLFEFKRLAVATNNFQDTNKLGQGGFGPVYKGRLEDGQEIAVKRLSTMSGQGKEEFMNEVQLISKLQHRNLVRLLGCCVDRAEKILVYEYMPNGSLDSFLFDRDPAKRKLLPWKTRYSIILGICRGLLYLHRDSRLKIIHRDLKASNILLDENLNPKISDFGMARIFGGNKDQDDTIRVVGTYGYMSPEYAMEGKFSEKSDVFSFGVLLLEIVSGQRNSVFWYEEKSLSLIGYAYKLWTEDNVISLMDPVIAEPCFLGEIQRCMQVALLCVQEATKDRPCISTVISMLTSETKDLPHPKEPGFSHRQISVNVGSSSQQSQQSSTAIYVSLTILSAR